ncbi:MAG: hypothetical protein IPH97_02900 [Ignavibacteriales bacterium]|nr:hypothetical protein [Ignavibacteriales bacterium]
MTQKANWKTITLILIGAIAFGLFSQFVLPKLIRPAVNVQLKEFAKAINADAPIMLTEDIRFDNVTLGKDNRIIYNYTLVNITLEETDTTYFKNQMRPTMSKQIRNSLEMLTLRELKTIFQYNYKDKNSNQVVTFVFKPDGYN